MKNGYVSDYPESSSRGRHHKREKPKQKTKGPLVVMRPNEYHGSIQFPESVHKLRSTSVSAAGAGKEREETERGGLRRPRHA
jgi:hypothetical protein